MQIESLMREMQMHPLQIQKTKTLTLLHVFQGHGEVFATLEGRVQRSTSSEEILSIYQQVAIAIDAVISENTTGLADAVGKLQEYITKLHQAEAADRANEDPDALLELL